MNEDRPRLGVGHRGSKSQKLQMELGGACRVSLRVQGPADLEWRENLGGWG